jgi:hypothetical protein
MHKRSLCARLRFGKTPKTKKETKIVGLFSSMFIALTWYWLRMCAAAPMFFPSFVFFFLASCVTSLLASYFARAF